MRDQNLNILMKKIIESAKKSKLAGFFVNIIEQSKNNIACREYTARKMLN